jgi:hypothetical protein
MTDGGPEFDNKELREACETRGTKQVIVAAYSPWINGLLEGMNSKLLRILKRLCAPDLGEDEFEAMGWKNLPKNWPDHLDEAVEILNNRILPSLHYSPNELLLGMVINSRQTPLTDAASALDEHDVAIHMALVDQQQFDGYSQIVDHAHRRKVTFDRKVMGRTPREVIFKAGQLVQVYRSNLDYTFLSVRKMEAKWSVPRRVVERDRNSYTIATLKGAPIPGRFSSRRLRRFFPREGTNLAVAQALVEAELGLAEEEADKPGIEEDLEGIDEQGETEETNGEELEDDLEDTGGLEQDDVALLLDPSDVVGRWRDRSLGGTRVVSNEGVASERVGTCTRGLWPTATPSAAGQMVDQMVPG